MISDQTTVVITPSTPASESQDALWQPKIGPETKDVIDRKRLPKNAGEAIIEAAGQILSRGINPNSTNRDQRTGLVVGYVQSGKTLSFTTAIALARDNGYRLIITIPGTSKPLLNQSTQRLHNDLSVDNIDGNFRWAVFTNPTDKDKRDVQQVLDEWRDPQVPESERPTVLITVMKHHIHLKKLIDLLRHLKLSDVPTLIVDDEADQASLNTRARQNDESTTYSHLLELRKAVPCHTFLQYTATPQAPLLINIIDSLSPEFVEVLEPGEDYIGGQHFFGHAAIPNLVKVIPDQEVPTTDNPLTDPPSSLLDALQVFLAGVSIGLIKGRSQNNTNRSMLVHPSRTTDLQYDYWFWINSIFNDWKKLLDLSENEPDRIDLMNEFRNAYDELLKTETTLPPFEQVSQRLPRAFRLTKIEEVNTRDGRPTPIVAWNRAYGWILVGGQAMDRGFTVEGLTVTYMPRGSGVGNADTIQQRGRFFGYKRPYIGFCRTYLEQDVRTAFEQYVHHEEEMRHQLQKIQESGESLRDWKRTFILAPDLKPCRDSVIQHGYVRGNYANRWVAQRAISNSPSVIDDNRKIALSFLNKFTFKPAGGNSNFDQSQKHDECSNISLSDVVNQLLLPYRFTTPRDTQEMTGGLIQLSRFLEGNSDERCTVYRMSPGHKRERSVTDNGEIAQLFQGANPRSNYPGDRGIHESEDVTIQVHFIDLTQNGNIVAREVSFIAIWIPQRMGAPWLIQEQS